MTVFKSTLNFPAQSAINFSALTDRAINYKIQFFCASSGFIDKSHQAHDIPQQEIQSIGKLIFVLPPSFLWTVYLIYFCLAIYIYQFNIEQSAAGVHF